MINQWYLPLYGCGACGVVVNALELSTNPQRISSLPQQLPSATLGEPENPSLNSDPGCIKVVDTYRGFDLAAFVRKHFSLTPEPPGPTVRTAAPGTKLLDYVHGQWPVLTQSAQTVPAFSTLLPLPFPYVVPGGRFREVYYWDSYFTMLGLIEDGQHALAVGMLKDFADEIAQYGHAPNGNRSYYLSRSQPPFFSFMVALIAEHDGMDVVRSYLPELQAEYDYWMRGATTTPPGQAFRNVVRLSDSTLLNRYWDARSAPRDESYKEDLETASHSNRPKGLVWRDLRAATATGWDFSSRWLADGKTQATVRTLEIAPVDLNALLVHLERMLARGYSLQGDMQRADDFSARAERRANAICRLMWNERLGAFTDYLWWANRQTNSLTAATLYPLFVHIASPHQASVIVSTGTRQTAGARWSGDDVGRERPTMGCAEWLGAAAMDRR